MDPRVKIEGYLVRMGLSFQEASPGTWIVSDAQRGLQNLVIALANSHVIVRMNIMEVPSKGREKLFEELLRLNAAELIHGAYGIEGRNVVIIDTLDADGIGLEAFEGTLDAIGLAVAQHYRILSPYRAKA
jgi:CesT_Tir_1